MARKAASAFEMIVSVAVVCAVAAGGLAVTYAATKERIAEQDRLAREKALAAAVSGARIFDPVSADALAVGQRAAGEVPVYGVYEARSDAGVVGWGVEVGPRGYGGPIRMVVGLDRNGKVLGVKIVSMNETPGLGTQITEKKAFLKQFEGIVASTAEQDVKKIDTITGATKSSRGARNGVKAAAAAYTALVEGGVVAQ